MGSYVIRWVIIHYYDLFRFSNYPRFGQWELLRACFHVLLTPLYHCFENFHTVWDKMMSQVYLILSRFQPWSQSL